MKLLTIELVDHDEQRYNTVGDWQTKYEGFEEVKVIVSKLGDWRYNVLVALHELVEMWLCLDHGINPSDVTRWDIKPTGKCPYAKEHEVATVVEKLVAIFLDVNWEEYEQRIADLEHNYRKSSSQGPREHQ